MTETIKMAEIQRSNIDFERQRHLANWLIKSSTHMAKPTLLQQQQIIAPPVSQQKLNLSTLAASNSKKGTVLIKNDTVIQNSRYFGHKSSLNKSSIFTSHTNLPLQIVTQSFDGHKPKLRRFNSHDTSANMFSVVDFENARLARRNEIEIQKYKMNSLNLTGDCSTSDSKVSKFSNDSYLEPLTVNIFLERYPLPRVIRLKYVDQFNMLHSSSSDDSEQSSDHKKMDKNGDITGELLVLYRHLKNRTIFHGYNTKNDANKKKVVKIPQDYQGYFSLVNERGQPTATIYTTIIQLVRERIYNFINVENMPTYIETQSVTFPTHSHYVKGIAKAGQIFRLLAVFQDGGINAFGANQHYSHPDSNNSSSTSQKEGAVVINVTGRDKERRRYAQLIGENKQIVYVSLSVKGKFYEIEQSIPQISQRSSTLGKTPFPKKLNNECIHHISKIVTSEVELPISLKFISGPMGCGNTIPEYLTIHQTSTENSLIVCPIDEAESRLPPYLNLRKLEIQPNMLLTKCYLGFETEQSMFTSQKLQNLLKFCQYNCDRFQRLIETEHNGVNHNNNHDNGLKILRPLNFSRFLNRDKIGHEKEDSIIFLSKNDLGNLEIHQQQQQLRKEEQSEIDILNNTDKDNQVNKKSINWKKSDTMKDFQINSHKKKWFTNFNNKNNTTRIAASSFSSLNDFVGLEQKRNSMDRYQDISRLLQDRFGDNIEFDSMNRESIKDEINRPSSEIGIDDLEIWNQPNLAKKTISLQNVSDHNLNDCNRRDSLHKPSDFLKLERAISTSNTIDYNERESYSTKCQQSFISEKLYNEFYVKSKPQNKSSSNLHQLLHFMVPQMSKKKHSMSKNVTIRSSPPPAKPLQDDINKGATPFKLTIEDDLPYSNVRDSLLTQQTSSINNGSDENNRAENKEFSETQTENIYAEICNDNQSFSSQTSNLNDSIVLNHPTNSATDVNNIKISISTSYQDHNIDNIYNTVP